MELWRWAQSPENRSPPVIRLFAAYLQGNHGFRACLSTGNKLTSLTLNLGGAANQNRTHSATFSENSIVTAAHRILCITAARRSFHQKKQIL